jgi:hypothetical protein
MVCPSTSLSTEVKDCARVGVKLMVRPKFCSVCLTPINEQACIFLHGMVQAGIIEHLTEADHCPMPDDGWQTEDYLKGNMTVNGAPDLSEVCDRHTG